MKRLFFRLFCCICCLAPFAAQATHNRAGEIHIQQIGPLRIRATIITWTKATSTNADRPVLLINWGDNPMRFDSVYRSNGGGNGEVFPNDYKYNIYIIEHTYAGPFTYRVSMTDPNRNGGILNVNPPSSELVPFHIETVFKFSDPQFGGPNTTPYLLQPPIDIACVGRPFKHNPNAFDPDGDSLSYALTVPLQSLGNPAPNYLFPNQIVPGPNNTLQIDSRNGDILWRSPQIPGEYNLAFYVISWRNGAPIDTTLRDLQILVDRCDNNPPVVKAPEKICVIAGQTVNFRVTANDSDPNNFVQLTAIGAPLTSRYSPATFNVPIGPRRPEVVGTFQWKTACEHISNQPYYVVFKGLDSVNRTEPRLTDLKTVEIKVVGPPPEGVQVVSRGNAIEVTWDKPYFCENADQRYFFGFSVWRREGANPFLPDTCAPGLAGRGYTEVRFNTLEMANGRYIFRDQQVEQGRTYCYRILAKFARISAGGFPFNLVESLPSKEVCVLLPRSLPLLTNVSVAQTNAQNGRIEVRWTKPVAADLDTILNPGPYRYEVQRAPGLTGGTFAPVPGGSFTAAQFWQANDTFFVDQSLNTVAQPYRYQIAFYVRGSTVPLGRSTAASSVFQRVGSSDRSLSLNWDERTPWGNFRYDIFRRNNATGAFDSIGSSNTPSYIDRNNLVNRTEYCYYVRSIGTYSIRGLREPLVNLSQQICGIPLDTIPPCTPTLTIKNLCLGNETAPPDPPYENFLTWTNPREKCPGSDDVVQYRIWYAPNKNTPLTLLATIDGANNTRFVHQLEKGVVGCYAVTAIDSVRNESRRDSICVDNCPTYTLPNVFTPNNDGSNDLYTPFPGWRFVERVEMQIFNRWGNLVFQTQDPNLNWNGQNQNGEPVADGTYFYVCRVFEERVEGTTPLETPLSGYIEVIRGE